MPCPSACQLEMVGERLWGQVGRRGGTVRRLEEGKLREVDKRDERVGAAARIGRRERVSAIICH